jgi:hypothetical protein
MVAKIWPARTRKIVVNARSGLDRIKSVLETIPIGAANAMIKVKKKTDFLCPLEALMTSPKVGSAKRVSPLDELV